MKPTYLSFVLSMPSRSSWNGRWSGESNFYCIIEKFSTIKGKEKARVILQKGNYYYRWSDGWAANIEVKEVDSKEARRLRAKSDGFCGYDWMVDSILERGEITA